MTESIFRRYTMKAVITVLGKDTVGILSKVSTACANVGVNIIEITQSVLQDMFAMIMLAEIDNATIPFDVLTEKLDQLGNENNLKIHVMHEDIFNSMHRI